jgi:hypothetical protein
MRKYNSKLFVVVGLVVGVIGFLLLDGYYIPARPGIVQIVNAKTILFGLPSLHSSFFGGADWVWRLSMVGKQKVRQIVLRLAARSRVSRFVFVFLVFLPGCGEQATKNPVSFSMEQWLDICSPLFSLDGEKMLMFRNADHTVTLHRIDRIRDPEAKKILETKNESTEQGTWTADNTTGEVVVNVAGDRHSYILVVPYELQCVLGAGQIDAVNLKSSWYGTPDFGDAGDTQ